MPLLKFFALIIYKGSTPLNGPTKTPPPEQVSNRQKIDLSKLQSHHKNHLFRLNLIKLEQPKIAPKNKSLIAKK
jgi:hypothetical protein